ncbi:MAG: hypothetical protein IPL54_09240 [Chitinophagaceae bacterium]|nr:hypothetical protein [Chitinophagaceae bacterium]
MKITPIISAIITATFIFSCSSTKINSSWKAENVQAKPYHNVMVWGLMTEKDSSLRKQMETHLMNDLIAKGYHAVSSMEVYKSKAYQKLTPKDIVDEFKLTGIDAVITIALLNKEKEEKYYPGGFYSQPPNTNMFGNLDNYYSGIYERVYTPGYYITTTAYFWESSFFEVKAGKMIYSVQTNSFDPNTTETLAHENGIKIMKDMVKHKVILDKAPKEE